MWLRRLSRKNDRLSARIGEFSGVLVVLHEWESKVMIDRLQKSTSRLFCLLFVFRFRKESWLLLLLCVGSGVARASQRSRIGVECTIDHRQGTFLGLEAKCPKLSGCAIIPTFASAFAGPFSARDI